MHTKEKRRGRGGGICHGICFDTFTKKKVFFGVRKYIYVYLDMYVSRRRDQETEALIVFPHRWGPPEVVGQVLGVYDMN